MIINTIGDVVWQSEGLVNKADLSDLSNGLYFCKYIKDGKLNTIKIIKSK